MGGTYLHDIAFINLLSDVFEITTLNNGINLKFFDLYCVTVMWSLCLEQWTLWDMILGKKKVKI